jgi:hypothetical protein
MAPISARIAKRRSLETNTGDFADYTRHEIEKKPSPVAEDVLRGESDHQYCRKIEAESDTNRRSGRTEV